MANLIVTPARGGGYTVIDADRQVEVAFFQNQNVANNFAAEGRTTAQAIRIASIADVRTSGGPLTENSTDTGTGLTAEEQQELFNISQRVNNSNPAPQTSTYTSPVIGNNVTYSTPDPAESPFAAERAARQAQVGQPVNTTLVANELYEGGVVREVVPTTTASTTTNQTPTLTEQINAVAQAQGIDPNAPLTAQEQEIFDIGQQLNSSAPAEVPSGQRGDELILLNTGEVVGIDNDGFTEAAGGLDVLPEEIPVEREGNELVNLNTGEVYPIEDDGFVVTDGGLRVLPEEVDGDPNATDPEEGGLIEFTDQGSVIRSASDVRALLNQAQQQQTVRAQRQNRAQAGDWRVRLRLAPQSNYLYNDPQCGPVLWPLRNTDGGIFPYTPSIDTAYKANYSPYDLTHSNYRGYFYQGSYVDPINIKAMFTAQDTSEANYLLATIHFFRSATKMFYGQDAQRGSPPPLVYLSGLGDFQFNEHPCVIAQFNYNLPSDVDYIRAQSGSSNGTNLQNQRDRQTIAGNPLSYALQRLATVGLTKGALPDRLASNTLGLNDPTYVPTKMDINLLLYPIQSREQVSKQFSVKNFANGNLLKGGFW